MRRQRRKRCDAWPIGAAGRARRGPGGGRTPVISGIPNLGPFKGVLGFFGLKEGRFRVDTAESLGIMDWKYGPVISA